MNTLLITYDLRGVETSADYKRVEKYMGSNCIKPLYTVWLLRTGKIAEKVRDELKAIMDENDRLFVIDVTGDASAWSNFALKDVQWIGKKL